MITGWEIYYILKLDSLVGFCVVFSICFGLFAFLSACAWIANSNEQRYETAEKCKKRFFKATIVFFVALFIALVIPTTKEIAIIKVIPAIANSEAVDTLKGDAKDLYNLGMSAAKEQLKKFAEVKK
jgi:H+/Cl- antiporter ClcA